MKRALVIAITLSLARMLYGCYLMTTASDEFGMKPIESPISDSTIRAPISLTIEFLRSMIAPSSSSTVSISSDHRITAARTASGYEMTGSSVGRMVHLAL